MMDQEKQDGEALGARRGKLMQPEEDVGKCHGIQHFSASQQEKNFFVSLNPKSQVCPPDPAKGQIVSEDPVEEKFLHGRVVRGTHWAVTSLVDDMDQLPTGTHGVMYRQTCTPSCSRYEEGDHFAVIEPLGKGGNGAVDLCIDKHSGKKFARKKLFNVKAFHRREVETPMGLQNKNIVQFIGIILREGLPEIYMEDAGLDLEKLVQDESKCQQLIIPHVVASLARQGLEALHFLHRQCILHLDIKPQNVCIQFPQPLLKLMDFGSCKVSQDPLQVKGWTVEYMSPEACQLIVSKIKQPEVNIPSQALTGKTDVFGFGATIAFMLCGKHLVPSWYEDQTKQPYSLEARGKIIQLVCNNVEIMHGIAKTLTNLTKDEHRFLGMTLAGNRDERSSAEEAGNFVEKEMLPRSRFETRPTRQLQQQPSDTGAEAREELEQPSDTCAEAREELEQPQEDEMEIDVAAIKQRDPILMAIPEAAEIQYGDRMSRVAGRTGQTVVLEEPPPGTSTMPKDQASAVADQSLAVAWDGNFSKSRCHNQIPAGMLGKGGRTRQYTLAAGPAHQQRGSSKSPQRGHLMQLQKRHPYYSKKFAASKLAQVQESPEAIAETASSSQLFAQPGDP